MLAACGGSDGGGDGSGVAIPAPPVGAPAPAPTPTPGSQCSLASRQDFVRAQIEEWHLFPDLLDLSVNQADHATVQSYIDALVAPARAQSRDRFFTYITSIADENAFYEQGASAGFGIRLAYRLNTRQVFVAEAFEGAPALAANIDRGTEILAIGTTSANLETVDSLLAGGQTSAVTNALGPTTAGTTRVLRVRDQSGVTREVTITKAQYSIDPVSDRYGARIIEDNGKRVGYLNLRTFIDTANDDLDRAFADFKAQGVTELIIDLRYNGGGLVSVAERLGDLLGAGRQGQVFSYTTFRASKAGRNDTYLFNPRSESIQPTKIAFIGTGSTASASELVINALQPYLGDNIALIGSNTFGKPVGQIALDRPACDDRLRVVAFRTENANRQGDYYSGLASTIPNTCAATDDYNAQLGDPSERLVATALDFLAGRSCTPISASQARIQSLEGPVGRAGDGRQLLRREGGGTIERELPGAF